MYGSNHRRVNSMKLLFNAPTNFAVSLGHCVCDFVPPLIAAYRSQGNVQIGFITIGGRWENMPRPVANLYESQASERCVFAKCARRVREIENALHITCAASSAHRKVPGIWAVRSDCVRMEALGYRRTVLRQSASVRCVTAMSCCADASDSSRDRSSS